MDKRNTEVTQYALVTLNYWAFTLSDGALWSLLLSLIPASIALCFHLQWFPTEELIVLGLLIFGAVFAVNSALHSFLIVHYAEADGVSVDVGFHYMANAIGRLLGTVLSGWVFQQAGLLACLWVSTAFLLATVLIFIALPTNRETQ